MQDAAREATPTISHAGPDTRSTSPSGGQALEALAARGGDGGDGGRASLPAVEVYGSVEPGVGWSSYLHRVYVFNKATGEIDKEFDVEILQEAGGSRKPFVGGYRDTRNGKEYHDAYTQTPVEIKRKYANAVPKPSRETQTVTTVTRSTQGKREGVAQTLRHDLYVHGEHDKVLVARPYFTADELQVIKEAKALIIQCAWRQHLARKRADELRAELAAEIEKAEAEAARKLAEEEERERRDIERRLHPRTRRDFAMLYDEIEAWRVSETARIKAELPDREAQTPALADLLAKETALLSTVERLRGEANKENAWARIEAMLEEMAAPKHWQLSDGEVAAVHTPLTTRAAELKALYEGLCDPSLSREDRVDLLLNVKYTVAEFDCPLTREIASLVDREADMLGRGRPSASLAGCRVRLCNLFLSFCESPLFNPEATRFSRLPADMLAPAVAQLPVGGGTLKPEIFSKHARLLAATAAASAAASSPGGGPVSPLALSGSLQRATGGGAGRAGLVGTAASGASRLGTTSTQGPAVGHRGARLPALTGSTMSATAGASLGGGGSAAAAPGQSLAAGLSSGVTSMPTLLSSGATLTHA